MNPTVIALLCIGGAALVLGGAGLLAGYKGYKVAFCRNALSGAVDSDKFKEYMKKSEYYDDVVRGTDKMEALDFEEVYITSRDGLRLYARYYPSDNPSATLLLMHGYRGSRLDFCGAIEFYRSLGLNILIPDERAHANSEGKHITFGIKERFDCADWAKYLSLRSDATDDLFLGGISMGASTVLMAAGLELPASVRGIIADCGYTSPYEIISRVARVRMHLPVKLIIPFTDFFARHFAGFSMREASAVETLRGVALPVLIIHGSADSFVPPEMSQENYDACAGEKQLFFADGAEHGMSFLARRDEVEKITSEFIRSHSTGQA